MDEYIYSYVAVYHVTDAVNIKLTTIQAEGRNKYGQGNEESYNRVPVKIICSVKGQSY